MIEVLIGMAWVVLPNRTVVIEDKVMHSIVEMADCRSRRAVNPGEILLKTDEEYPYCYIIQKEPIMLKKDGTWVPYTRSTHE